jgi:hypothetical protein
MTQALRQRVTIQPGGRIAIQSDRLTAGQSAEVIVLIEDAAPEASNVSLFGSGRGAFATPEEADEFLRRERDRWPA